MKDTPTDSVRCYACFKSVVRTVACPDCLNEFCGQDCLSRHRRLCRVRLEKLDPAPRFICPYCGTAQEPTVTRRASSGGALASGLVGFLFGWIFAAGAQAALADDYRECSRCGKSLDDVPKEGRAY